MSRSNDGYLVAIGTHFSGHPAVCRVPRKTGSHQGGISNERST